MKKILCLILCSAIQVGVAEQAIEPRMQIPVFFDHSWIGLNIGVKNTPFTADDFQSGFDFKDKQDTLTAMQVSIGHYFNPYWALSLSLMRGINSNEFSDPVPSTVDGVDISSESGKVSETLLAFTMLPTWPINAKTSLYAQGGVGMISRNGFSIKELPVVTDANILTGVIGAGVRYELPYHWFLDVSAIYALPVDHEQQPGIFYAALGVDYLLVDDNPSRVLYSHYYFPKHLLEISAVNDDVFYLDAASCFTPPDGIPIFFDGSIKVGKGLELMYERNFFHTSKNFSLEWGVSIAGWQTRDLQQDFYTLSIFPEMKVWMWRSDVFDCYFTYSLAGPSYLSQRYLDNQDAGSHFTFQDFLGVGALFGAEKQISASLKIVHYSNGNLLPNNPGVDVPVMLGLGWNF